MHKNFFIDIITRKPDLFAAILRFNGFTAPRGFADAPVQMRDLCAAMPEGLLDELLRNTRSRRHLCALSHSANPFWDFAEESRRLALLEPETLTTLTRFYGAGLHALEVARTVLGREVAALREAIGERAYLYALQRGQYQALAGRELFAARHRDLNLPERINLHGREALGLITAEWPQPLQNIAPVAALSDIALQTDTRRGMWFDLKKTLLKEVAATWAPCFD